MKDLILADWSWRRQRGPDDLIGFRADAERCAAIRSARSWDDLDLHAPLSWERAVANRCRKEDL